MKINLAKATGIFFLIVILGIIFLMGCLMIHDQKQVAEYCDNEYGLNNWEWKEVNKETTKYYIGQVWECVPIPNETLIN